MRLTSEYAELADLLVASIEAARYDGNITTWRDANALQDPGQRADVWDSCKMRIGGDASLATSLSHAPGVRMPRVVRPFEEQMHIFRKYKAAASDERQLTVMNQRAESQLGATRAAKIELEARQEETELHNAEAAAALAAERQKLEEEQGFLATAQRALAERLERVARFEHSQRIRTSQAHVHAALTDAADALELACDVVENERIAGLVRTARGNLALAQLGGP